MREHLEDAIDAGEASGLSREQAEHQALSRFGTPQQAATLLSASAAEARPLRLRRLIATRCAGSRSGVQPARGFVCPSVCPPELISGDRAWSDSAQPCRTRPWVTSYRTSHNPKVGVDQVIRSRRPRPLGSNSGETNSLLALGGAAGGAGNSHGAWLRGTGLIFKTGRPL